MTISKQHIKAFFISFLSLKFPVIWGRRKRCRILSLKWSEHPWIVKFLEHFYDVRCRMDGGVELWFKDRERKNVNRRRVIKKLISHKI